MRRNSEAFERVAKERQIFAGICRVRVCRLFGHLLKFIRREVRRVRDGTEMGNKGSIDLSDNGPVHTIEKGVGFNLVYGETLVVGRD